MKDRLLGDTIRAARMEKGYTQEKLSELLDITLVHLANIEGGWYFRTGQRTGFCIPTG